MRGYVWQNLGTLGVHDGGGRGVEEREEKFVLKKFCTNFFLF
jgi:hypothetical protein